MTSWTIVIAIAANATNANVNSASAFPTAPHDGYLNLYSTASADGLDSTLFVGRELSQPASRMNANNRVPQVGPGSVDVTVGGVPVLEGETISLPITNTTAGALTARVTFQLMDE